MTRRQRAETDPERNAAKAARDGVQIDGFRTIVFPNHIRALRKQRGFPRLLALTARLSDMAYIRLSKIERGEVFAKAEELRMVAGALGAAATDLLIDIDDADFDIAAWAAELQDWTAADPGEDHIAVLLAAATRARRDSDPDLSIAAIERDFGIAPVILSRIENAFKTLDRWNAATIAALCGLFGVRDEKALRAHVVKLHKAGALDAWLDLVANPSLRIAKTRARVAALRAELAQEAPAQPTAKAKAPQPVRVSPVVSGDPESTGVIAAIHATDSATVRLVPVYGAPLPDGLIAKTPTGEMVEAPRSAGPDAYGLRACRSTLGPGLPASATVIADPGRFPSSGGLAVLREAQGLRLLSVTFGRDGGMMGYSSHPDREVALDGCDPRDLAAIIAAIYE